MSNSKEGIKELKSPAAEDVRADIWYGGSHGIRAVERSILSDGASLFHLQEPDSTEFTDSNTTISRLGTTTIKSTSSTYDSI